MSTKTEDRSLSRAFGATVRVFRNEIGVSQEAFAHLCGLDRTYVSLIERGIRNPTIKTVWTVAEALGKSPSDLLRRVERALAAEQESETKKGGRDSNVPPAAKKTGKHLGHAGRLGKAGKPGGGDKN